LRLEEVKRFEERAASCGTTRSLERVVLFGGASKEGTMYRAPTWCGGEYCEYSGETAVIGAKGVAISDSKW
jgi:hypothetical protein